MKIFNFDKPFTVTDGDTSTEYPGIVSYTSADAALSSIKGALVVIVMIEGDSENWIVNGQEGVDSLRRYYAKEYGSGVQMQFFKAQPSKLNEAIDALEDMGDPDSLKILNLVDRLLADDWSGTGVYEGLDALLTKAESLVKPGTLSETM